MLQLYHKFSNDKEWCFYIFHDKNFDSMQLHLLCGLLNATQYRSIKGGIEIGPKPSICTSWCTNVLTILAKIGITNITRIEHSLITTKIIIFDEMTHQEYPDGKNVFAQSTGLPPTGLPPTDGVYDVYDIEKFGNDFGLNFDQQDLEYFKDIFSMLKRQPTNVELYHLAQANSEHCRHGFFKGKFIIDDIPQSLSPMELVKSTLGKNTNSMVAFSDNASAIKGSPIHYLYPKNGKYVTEEKLFHPTLTAETHNYPTGISPFPGANTGVGGRIRDNQSIGRGGLPLTGSAGYCVGNLAQTDVYPEHVAKPLDILIQGSNGASDYGNKFGEPIIHGFCRSFGINIDGKRIEWIKPIMFTSGTGLVFDGHLKKQFLESNDLVVKIGGPAYRIGMGGGSNSSATNKISKKDFSAVQRGDPEMQNKMNRVVRQCIELFDRNPIKSIHDQGAGGNANVLQEIVEPWGGVVDLKKFTLGDHTLTPLEIWCAEYQENNAIVINPKDAQLLQDIAKRENVGCDIVGKINNSKRIQLKDGDNYIVDLPMISDTRQKTWNLKSAPKLSKNGVFSYDRNVENHLEKILLLLSVGSKEFLTNKVDRSVTGLVAQQQCVGPYQLPLANVAVTSHSFFDKIGTATAIGEQPIKGIADISSMVRMCIAEMLTNMVWAKITRLEDIKCSANWMWSAKYGGAELYRACEELSSCLKELGVAIDGGKDSLSMATVVDPQDHPNVVDPHRDSGLNYIECPKTLVLTGYALCDITRTVTPDLKRTDSVLVYIPITDRYRLGGSAFAQVNNLLGVEGIECPTIDMTRLASVFNAVQKFPHILAGHDVSDGGLITTLIEMAISGGIGLEVDLDKSGLTTVAYDPISILFAEETGLVLEVPHESYLEDLSTNFYVIGYTNSTDTFSIKNILSKPLLELRKTWSRTSFELEKCQMNKKLAKSSYNNMTMQKPQYNANSQILRQLPNLRTNHRVAIIREEGSNGDREMAAAFYTAGFNTFDVTISDIIDSKVNLEDFNGIAFVGGFTFSDVLGAARGWAKIIQEKLADKFLSFLNRKNTFSLGVCNGCQLMAQLGWVKGQFVENDSGKFESRYLNVKIVETNCIFFKGFEECTLPVWSAHGEGKYISFDDFQDAPIYYVDNNNKITEEYPYNPNGSKFGIAGVCSENGRHLAMMPHPERSFLKWQLSYLSQDTDWSISPWIHMFYNALKWVNSV